MTAMWRRFLFLALLFLSLAFVAVLIYAKPWSPRVGERLLEGVSLTVYATRECGCCHEYARYLKDLGAKVTIIHVNATELGYIKRSLGIPMSVWSCHTAVVENLNYFIEGHVPGEAIAKLVTDKPHIRGIALPSMPPGSPGMPGVKSFPLVVYAVNQNWSQSIFSTH